MKKEWLPIAFCVAFALMGAAAGVLITNAIRSYPAYNVQLPALSDEQAEHDRPCDVSQENRNSDLCAQWKAADAAAKSAEWTKWQAIISFFGFAGVLAGLWFTKVQNDFEVRKHEFELKKHAEAVRTLISFTVKNAKPYNNSVAFTLELANKGRSIVTKTFVYAEKVIEGEEGTIEKSARNALKASDQFMFMTVLAPGDVQVIGGLSAPTSLEGDVYLNTLMYISVVVRTEGSGSRTVSTRMMYLGGSKDELQATPLAHDLQVDEAVLKAQPLD